MLRTDFYLFCRLCIISSEQRE